MCTRQYHMRISHMYVCLCVCMCVCKYMCVCACVCEWYVCDRVCLLCLFCLSVALALYLSLCVCGRACVRVKRGSVWAYTHTCPKYANIIYIFLTQICDNHIYTIRTYMCTRQHVCTVCRQYQAFFAYINGFYFGCIDVRIR